MHELMIVNAHSPLLFHYALSIFISTLLYTVATSLRKFAFLVKSIVTSTHTTLLIL